jgi:copper chaperone CopZ
MTQLDVTGMSCGGCVKSVTKIIARATESESETVKVDLESARAEFPDTDDATLNAVLQKLDAAGFSSTVTTS